MVEEVSIYPTRTRSELTLSLSEKINYMVHIYDISGNLVKLLNDVSGLKKLCLDNLHSGMYIVTVTSMMGVKKVVKVLKE